MTETILVLIAVFAALAIVARKAGSAGSNFPEPLEQPAELPDPVASEAETNPDRA